MFILDQKNVLLKTIVPFSSFYFFSLTLCSYFNFIYNNRDNVDTVHALVYIMAR